MTTEVAVMNRTAISLAADSAVTIGGDKVYNTVNKLFTLSKTEPVGVMVYGSASIMNVPWETVIKTYRKELGAKSFPTLKAYSDDFIEFLSRDGGIFSEKARERFIDQTVLSLCDLMREEVVNDERLQGDSDESIYKRAAQIASEIVKREYEAISEGCEISEISDRVEKMLEVHGDRFYRLAASSLEKIFPLLEVGDKELLRRALAMYFHSDYLLGDFSGIVIAGFGEQDLFPKVITMHMQGFLGSTNKVVVESSKSNLVEDEEFSASIIPFAQSDMIHTFLAGIDPFLDRVYRNEAAGTIMNVVDAAADKVREDEREQFRTDLAAAAEEAFGSMLKAIETKQRETYLSQVISMLDSLPKDELAEMAETLVNLIAFKKKVTRGTESVGGPIDVAIITKGDGFVWMKRKHYFDPALNHHFFSNYNKNI
jgi:hypothetical protein